VTATQQQQDINHFKELAKEHKFKVIGEWSNGEILHLKMLKES
jgi:hypothetical protein